MASSPRIRVFIYVVLTFVFSSPFYVLCCRRGLKASLVYGLMWCPAIAGLLTTLLTKRSFREFGWRLGKAKYLLAAWLIPMAYSWPAYVLVWATGLGGFPNWQALEQVRGLLHMPSTPTWLLLIVVYLLDATAIALFSCLSAAGEEIGWRGFLVPELMKFNSFTRTSLITGVIWTVWHVPLIVWSSYNPGTPAWYAIPCFATMVVSVSFVFAWLRLKSGSLWPAVLLHATHNAIIQTYLDVLTVNRGHTKYITGEMGCALVPFILCCAWIAWRHRAAVEGADSPAVMAPSSA